MADLLHSPEIYKIESRYVSLFERTIEKGFKGAAAPTLSARVRRQFRSATFQTQLDQILDDLTLLAVDHSDRQITGSATASSRAKLKRPFMFASTDVLPLTEELVKQSAELAQGVAESIVEMLKEEGIYQVHPNILAKRITELWGGEKYRAVRFSRTFSADVANNTTLHRYKQHKIKAWEFRAKLDEKTTIQCQMLHGTIFYTDSDSSTQYRPPLHFHCRSSMWPVPITQEIDDSLIFENRDFSALMDQDIKLDPELITKGLEDVSMFNDKYTIDKFILQEDIERRLLKLKVGIDNEKINISK